MTYPVPAVSTETHDAVPATMATGSSASSVMSPKVWLDYRHPDWEKRHEQWKFNRMHYTGDLLLPKHLPFYLYQRRRGEPIEAFAERLLIADYTPHFPAVVDSLAGMLYASEAEAKRRWGAPDDNTPALGAEDDPSTPAGRLWIDADGMGNGWTTLWKITATDLISMHNGWGIADSIDGEPFVRIIPAESVVNWLWKDGVLAEVLMCESADTRDSLEQDPETEERYIRFRLDGWQRFRKTKDNKVEALAGAGNEGTYVFEDPRGRPALPIYPIQLPTRRMVGYLLAKKANAIFNMESCRDQLLRVANFPKLNLIAKDNLFRKLVKGLSEGDNVLQNDPTEGVGHNYIAPPATAAQIATDTILQKITSFYATAFREYGDMARTKTATEVRQDVASGVGAFLQLLKGAVDDAENNALWRIEQILFPNDRTKWFQAHVERSDNFVPIDVNAVMDAMAARYYGPNERVPLGRKAQIQAAKRVAEWDGLDADDNEIAAAVDVQNILKITAAVATGSFELPPEGKARLGIKLLETTGVIAPEDETKTADGAKVKLRDVMLQQMIDAETQKQQDMIHRTEFNQKLRDQQANQPPAPVPQAKPQ